MKHLDEYRDARAARALAAEIARRARRRAVLMEICGGQTHTLMRYGIDELLPPQVELVHGPGCPVCVTPVEVVDKAVEIASHPGVTFVSFGDMLRVPGSRSDLFRARAAGADVRVAYSPMEALRIARAEPGRTVVFFGIGFETTAPVNAMALIMARREGLGNFSMLASHVLVPPAIRMLLGSPGNRVEGFIAPGHVAAVTGTGDYLALSRDFRVPIVVGGFEPTDLLRAILMLVAQLDDGRAEVENAYTRAVTPNGNPVAREAMTEVFEIADRNWRGIGSIPSSGLRIRREYAAWDAEQAFGEAAADSEEPAVCIAAEVLQGRARPTDCPAFATVCTPENPLGAPMVSGEGACAAYYNYRPRAARIP